MKIFILEPSERWNYCGGARVVIAESLDRVREIFRDDTIIQLENEETDNRYHVWIVTHVLETDDETERVLVDNYNWS